MLVTIGLLMSSMTSASSFNVKENEEWETEIWATETDGRHDYVVIGEKTDASEMKDQYDVPKCPSPPQPFIRAYVYHAGMPYPFEYLWFEYRDANLKTTKEYQLCVMCYVFDPTEITIAWDKTDFRSSGYKKVTLLDAAGIPLVNMKAKNSYTYQSDAFSFNVFIIRTDPFIQITKIKQIM